VIASGSRFAARGSRFAVAGRNRAESRKLLRICGPNRRWGLAGAGGGAPAQKWEM